MKTKTKTKKFYWTKKRKKQRLYIILLIISVVLATLVIGVSDVHTQRQTTYTPNSINVPHIGRTQPIVVEEVLTVKERVQKIAQENNFPWVDYLLRLAHCESRFDPYATNDNGAYGIDRGVFQINDYFHPEVSDEQAFDIEWATKWTMGRIESGYQHEWVCDEIVKRN